MFQGKWRGPSRIYRMWRQRLNQVHMAIIISYNISIRFAHHQPLQCISRAPIFVMPGNRCAVQGCSNEADLQAGISIHSCPCLNSERDKWVRFVRLHRANFDTKAKFSICSVHFQEDCFERTLHVEGSQRRLLPRSVPTIWKINPLKPSSARERRMVNTLLYSLFYAPVLWRLEAFFSLLFCTFGRKHLLYLLLLFNNLSFTPVSIRFYRRMIQSTWWAQCLPGNFQWFSCFQSTSARQYFSTRSAFDILLYRS